MQAIEGFSFQGLEKTRPVVKRKVKTAGSKGPRDTRVVPAKAKKRSKP
jgi:hypothetical protein